jgi:DNA modification methylase
MRAKDRPLANDSVPEEEFGRMVGQWFSNVARVLLPGRGFYIWGGYSNLLSFPRAIVDAGLYFSQTIIWVKGWPVLTRKDFMGDHEWCYYGWKLGAAHYFNPAVTNASDVWAVRKTSPTAMCHLTEKPAELAERAIRLEVTKLAHHEAH